MKMYRRTAIDLGVIVGLFLAFAFSFDQGTPINIVIVSTIFLTTASILGIISIILIVEKRTKMIEFREGKIDELIDRFEENKKILTDLQQQQKSELTDGDKLR